jgi:hypothetical protein
MKLGIETDIAGASSRYESAPGALRSEVLDAAQLLNRALVDRARALASGPLVNVRSGRYRASIHASARMQGDVVTGAIFASAKEARFIEYGARRRISARHVLQTAIDQMRGDISGALNAAIARGLDRARS